MPDEDAISAKRSPQDEGYRFSIKEIDRREEPKPPVIELVVGAWKEALAAEGSERIALIALLALLTIAPVVLVLLMFLAWVGVI